MKHLFVTFLVLLGNAAQCQTDTSARLKFDTTVWDFGDIVRNVHVRHKFWFKNTGNTPIVVFNVYGSTVYPPEWEREPVLPGDSGFVEVLYRAFNPGYFTKMMSGQTNAGGFSLTIKGKVFEVDTLAIHFDKTTHDFGQTPFTNELSCQFIVQNTGSYPLTINRINSSSGNLVFSWPNKPIPTVGTSIIKAKMLISTLGTFNKTGTVFIDGVAKPYLLFIKGEIIPVATESSPPSQK